MTEVAIVRRTRPGRSQHAAVDLDAIITSHPTYRAVQTDGKQYTTHLPGRVAASSVLSRAPTGEYRQRFSLANLSHNHILG